MSKEFYRRYPRRQRSEKYREQHLSRGGKLRNGVSRHARRSPRRRPVRNRH